MGAARLETNKCSSRNLDGTRSQEHSGTAYLTNQGTLVNDGMLGVFPASAAVAPRDGFPDDGAVPAAVFPWRYESKRVEVQQPYPLL